MEGPVFRRPDTEDEFIPPIPPVDGIVHGVCPHDCADTCSVLCHVEGGRLVEVTGNPSHPITQGFLCDKLSRAPQAVYAADRLQHPLLRTGPKGRGEFHRISWDEAIRTIADRWRDIVAESGPHAILPFFGSGTEGLVQGDIAGRRFFNRLGTLQLVRTICTRAGRTGYQYTMGDSTGADPTAIKDVEMAIAWGLNAPSTNIHHHTFLKQARANGALYAVINPLRITGATGADYVLQPRPGSDAALALGMMHVIIGEGLHDEDFIRRFTLGFEQLRERVKAYPPERVETLTDIPADTVRKFARLYARRRPSFIYVGPGCQRHSNGGMTVRTIACLPALVGAWREPGGGIYFPTSTVFPADWSPLLGEQLRPNPPAGYNMIHLGRLLATTQAPIKSLYVFNGNPATVLYNQRLVRRGLERDDLFTVVHERFLTDTARYADIVLPATTQFEHPDLLFSYYHPSLLLNRPAIPPPGECRSNLEVFAMLATAMGFAEPCFGEDAWDVIQAILELDEPSLDGVTLDALLEHGWVPAALPAADLRIRDCTLATPSGRIELYSRRMEADGLDPLPGYVPPRESRETTPELFAKYPLCLITPSGHSFHNSSYAQDAGRLESEHHPTVTINPADAAARGIEDGDRVAIVNDRGRCELWAVVSSDIRPGAVASAGQWWSRHYPDGGNVNFTTPDFVADMGGGSAFNTNLVEVERIAAADAVAVEVRR